ncbi:MAG TPA: 2-oxoglutarate and iron-dependent oxygenase domain-containing protein [Candidatus Methylomirabilis sp.]|nr:2-oxoglutarate and iron-dependent oxygenase domain-containing protein [Candidatus Methylomirabilis sp.]
MCYSVHVVNAEPDIPAVDIAPYLAGDPEGIKRVVEAVGAACERIGFLVIEGHGVPGDLVRRVFEVSLAFFELPLEEKLALRSTDPGVPRGYSALASKSLGRTYGLDAPPDLREQFFVGPLEDWAAHYRRFPGAAKVYAGNVWPPRPAEFRDVLTTFYRAQERLAAELMRIFALALGLPAAWFDGTIDRHFSTVPSNFYPEPADEPLPGQLRAGPHTDFGSLTILAVNDAPGGLQVLFPDGSWRDVRPAPGQFVVNLGDMMGRWTNDRWKSTVHRVVNPPRDRTRGSRRQTVGFFLHPNYDARVACLPTCTDADHPPRYSPILAGEHMLSKLERRESRPSS